MSVDEVTLEDVARAAGVSASTASRAINGSSRRVRPENEERVRDAALRLGYAVDIRAQSTAKRRSDVIAIVVPDLTDADAMAAAADVARLAEARGLSSIVIGCDVRRRDSVDRIRWLRGQRPDSLVVVGTHAVDAAVQQEFDQFCAHGGAVIHWNARKESESSPA